MILICRDYGHEVHVFSRLTEFELKFLRENSLEDLVLFSVNIFTRACGESSNKKPGDEE